MAVAIRLKRMGTNRRPFNRIVVIDSRKPRDGRYIENLGYYDALTSPATIELNVERAEYWISKGAQPSATVSDLIKKAKLPKEIVAAAEQKRREKKAIRKKNKPKTEKDAKS